MARRRVTGALCGDGGDEDFAGYHRHQLQVLLGHLPRLPEGAGRWLSALTAGAGGSRRNPLWVAQRVATALALHPARRNLRFMGHFDEADKAWLYTPEFAAATEGQATGDLMLDLYRESGARDPLDAILYAEIGSSLADTLLPKVDITAMAHALEVRSPFLDHELMGFAARLPASLKVRWLESKWILKRALRALLPKEILERPKMGFGVPLDRWFGGDWRPLLHDVLLSERALARGYFRPQALAELVRRWERGGRFGQYHLYDLLVLELWHRRFVDSR